jgi:ribonuclease HII
MNHFPWDNEYLKQGSAAGIDEAGRGCLSGPVVVAGVVWQPHVLADATWFATLNDSKALSEEKRTWLYPRIIAAAEHVHVAVISHIIVDYINIFQAAMYGFELVAQQMPEHVPLCVDGNHRPASLKRALPLVKGDRRASAVAAAGVIAKVTRDHLVDVQHEHFPQYGFIQHKGYATATHRRAITEHGPAPIHRKSFAPVKDLCSEVQPMDAELERIMQDSAPQQAWQWFQDHYHEFSLPAARVALQQFQQTGNLPVLPHIHDRILLEAKCSFLKPEIDPALLPLFNS